MLISHETPISFLDESRKYNDYDYALVHLFDTHPEYYSFFKSSLLQGREVLLDNSIFELKEAFDAVKYAIYIDKLKPTYFIVPDVLENSEATIDSFKRFKSDYKDLPGLYIGAVQGRTYQEIVDCYRYMSENADYIAMSFDFSWYQTIGLETRRLTTTKRELQRMSTGRQKLIEMLHRDGIWNNNKPHHLLGCSLVEEFKAYKSIKSIRSCDTSSPVVYGITGSRYIKGLGNTYKPSVLLADLIDYQVTEEQKEDILFNVKEFRNIVNG